MSEAPHQEPVGSVSCTPMTPEEQLQQAVFRRKAMVNHSLKVLAGQGVKPLLVLGVEEVAGLFQCDPETAAKTLDLAAVDVNLDPMELLGPIFERVKAGETMASFLEAQKTEAPNESSVDS